MPTEQPKTREQHIAFIRRYGEEIWNTSDLVVGDIPMTIDFDGHPLPRTTNPDRSPTTAQHDIHNLPDRHTPNEGMTAQDNCAVLWNARGAKTDAILAHRAALRKARDTNPDEILAQQTARQTARDTNPDTILTHRAALQSAHNPNAMPGKLPMGKPATMNGMFINRIVEGAIVEGWRDIDTLGLMQETNPSTPQPTHN